MKNKSPFMPKALALLMAAAVLFTAAPATALDAEKADLPLNMAVEDGDNYVIKGFTYKTNDPSDPPTDHFEVFSRLNGEEVTVIEVTEPVIISKEPVSPKNFHYTSQFFAGEEKDHMPPETTTMEDTNVVLRRKVKKESAAKERTKHVFQDVSFTALEEGSNVPQKQDIEFTDVDSEQKVIASMNLVSATETDCYWSDEFSFPIKVTGYDADTFVLGETEIGREEDLNNFKSAFLDYLSLDPEWYEITEIVWDGEPYEEDGEICRNAIASGNKKVRDFTATYEGDVTLPEIEGFVWECEYEEIIPEDKEFIYTMSTDVTLSRTIPEKESNWLKDLWNLIKEFFKMLFEIIVGLIKEHPAESITILTVFALGIAFLLFKAGRKVTKFTVISDGASIRENPSDTAREVSYRINGEILVYARRKENGFVKVYTDKERLSTGWIKENDIEEAES